MVSPRDTLAPPVGPPDLEKETTACSIKLEFQINKVSFHTKVLYTKHFHYLHGTQN